MSEKSALPFPLKRTLFSVLMIPGLLLYVFSFLFFYYRYVPLIKSYQAILIPLLATVVVLMAKSPRLGILFFVFTFPLINNIPYLCGIKQNIPHAPAALVFCLAFVLGFILHSVFSRASVQAHHTLFKPIMFFSIVITVSCSITILRFLNFFPFLSQDALELIVNVNGVRSGGAVMSSLFGGLNYLTGFFVFWIIFRYVRTDELRKKVIALFCTATFFVVAFALVQKFFSIELGNTATFIYLERLNSTLKDPNSLGVFLAAAFPVTLGFFLAASKRVKVPVFVLLIIILYIFPAAGSRSGMVGLIIAVVAFVILWQFKSDQNKKKKAIAAASALFIIAFCTSAYVLLFKDTNLINRLGNNIRQLQGELISNKMGIAMGRQYLWRVGAEMFRESPVTGVGLGAYIIDLPSFAQEMDLTFSQTDSSENYFIQVAAETGIIGLCLALWLFFVVMRLIRSGVVSKNTGKSTDFIRIGLICGIVAVLVNFFFHTYIGAYDVKYTFWLLVGLLATFSDSKESSRVGRKGGLKGIWLAVLLLTVVFGGIHLKQSLGPLSLEDRAERFGWRQDFGFYMREKDELGINFRWTGRRSGLSIPALGNSIVIPVRAAHPRIEDHPVEVDIFLADKYFTPGVKLKHVLLRNPEWIECELHIDKEHKSDVQLVFQCSRTWQPFRQTGAPDRRELGIAVGEIWYSPYTEDQWGNFRTVQIVSPEMWDGLRGSLMYSNATNYIKFILLQPCQAFRIQVRGESAFGAGPMFIIRVDQEIVGRTMLRDEKWTYLFFPKILGPGEHQISVEFLNDITVENPWQDRNLFLGRVEFLARD